VAVKKVAVLVAGSWGTALASLLADIHVEVMLWSRNASEVDDINQCHTNRRFFKDVPLSLRLKATLSMEEAIKGAEAIVIAAPSAAMRGVCALLRPLLTNIQQQETLIVHVAKGFEAETMKRMTTVIAEELPECNANRIVVLSGPSHAEEVIIRCPTTVLLQVLILMQLK
jgi:glycerol-3-phosphate dehydrogenase (NAD(P)+)